jgi:hypothetical protein
VSTSSINRTTCVWILNLPKIVSIYTALSVRFEITRSTREVARSTFRSIYFFVALCRSIACRMISAVFEPSLELPDSARKHKIWVRARLELEPNFEKDVWIRLVKSLAKLELGSNSASLTSQASNRARARAARAPLDFYMIFYFQKKINSKFQYLIYISHSEHL